MAQIIKQGNIFGRIGTGIGKGLAEQLPKEMERGRLASGLKEIGEQKDLTPFQQYAGLVKAAHEYPQVVQSGAELLKQQQIRDAYKKGRTNRLTGQSQANPGAPNPTDVQFAQMPGQVSRNPQMGNGQQNAQTVPSNIPREQEALANQPAASKNPLSSEYVPAAPWNQERQEAAINEAFDRGLARDFGEANQFANTQRELYERAPEKYREQLDYQKGVDQETDNAFDKHLQTRLQKEGNSTFADIPGDLQLNIKKKARNSVATGKMTPEQAAEYYSKKALDLVKDKGRALQIANRDIFDRVLPHKKEEAVKNLKGIAKSYKEMGSDEDFYNFLRSDQIDKSGNQTGMGLSPGGAAEIQYERSPKVKELIRSTANPYRRFPSEVKAAQEARLFAENLSKVMTPEDSFLAIAREKKETDVNFDEYAFFDYLRENRDQFSSIPRLNREINQGVSDFFPNWRDIGLFPAFGKAVKND